MRCLVAIPILVSLLLPPAAIATSSREFKAPYQRVLDATRTAIEARGCVAYVGDQTFSFLTGSVWGRAQLEKEPGDLARVSVAYDAPKKKGRELEDIILSDIADVIEGKALRIDEKLRTKSCHDRDKFAQRRAAAAAESQPPASASIRASIGAVKSGIMAACASYGFAVSSETEHEITVFKDVSAANFLSIILFGNAAPRSARVSIQFMLGSAGDLTRVDTAADAVIENAYGQTSRIVVTDRPEIKGNVQNILNQVKAKLEQQ